MECWSILNCCYQAFWIQSLVFLQHKVIKELEWLFREPITAKLLLAEQKVKTWTTLAHVDLKEDFKIWPWKREFVRTSPGRTKVQPRPAFMLSLFLLTGPGFSRAAIGWHCCCVLYACPGCLRAWVSGGSLGAGRVAQLALIQHLSCQASQLSREANTLAATGAGAQHTRICTQTHTCTNDR